MLNLEKETDQGLLRFGRQSEKLRRWNEPGENAGRFPDSVSKPVGASRDRSVFTPGSLSSPEVIGLSQSHCFWRHSATASDGDSASLNRKFLSHYFSTCVGLGNSRFH